MLVVLLLLIVLLNIVVNMNTNTVFAATATIYSGISTTTADTTSYHVNDTVY